MTGKGKEENTQAVRMLPTSIKKKETIGSKNRESPSPEGKRGVNVGLTSGCGKFVGILHRIGMELTRCKFGRPSRVNP
eukprot:1160599-Pelagomonas_calceolata.AAC.2